MNLNLRDYEREERLAPGGARALRLWSALAIVVALFYLLQTFSPLRLSFDTVVLLSVAESASQGEGFLDRGHTTVYPPGYPALVAVLRKAGIATPASLVGLNLVFLAAGLLGSAYVLSQGLHRARAEISGTMVLCLLSFVFLKHATLAMSDVPFFGVEAGCLAAMVSASETHGGRGFWPRALGAAVLLLAALAFRRVGLALIPPFFWMLFSSRAMRSRFQSHKTAALTICGLVAVGGFGIVVKTFTLHDFGVVARTDGLLRLPTEIISYRLTELAEAASNVPTGKTGPLPAALPLGLGVIVLLLVIRGLLTLRGGTLIKVFMASYMAVLFAWPYRDTRFWLPVLPFLFTCIFQALGSLPGGALLRQRIQNAYRLAFVVLGFVSLANLTYITFSGDRFAERYANGSYRASYCAVWKNCGSGYNPEQVDTEAAHILEVYR